jgi:hypothetical protein
MDARTALHTAARRFCESRFSEWIDAYSELQRKESYGVEDLFKRGWNYSDDAYRVFPRYRLDSLIQVEVEKLTPQEVQDIDCLRATLEAACTSAKKTLLAEFTEENARRAIQDEANDFEAYIKALTYSDLGKIQPLPYRRVLTEQESETLWSRLSETWGVGNGYWFPLREGPVPNNLLAFHTDYFRRMGGADVLRELLEVRGVTRVLQLCELKSSSDPDYECGLSLLDPRYARGGEQYSTSVAGDWIVYASHESSATIGGDWLVNLLEERWTDWSERRYDGPYSTDDMRGTWNTDR